MFWGVVALLGILWLAADPLALRPSGFFALRGSMVQLSGILAMSCMSVAMMLAVRPRWPERWIGGLDKMYRLHKWLGVGGLVLAIIHWLWSQGPKWVVGLGFLDRPERGARPAAASAVEEAFRSWRGTAEGVGEWAYYAAVLLIAVALIHAAIVVLVRRVGASRKVDGTITRLHYFPSLRVLEGDIDIPQCWPGHKPGQFAFVTSGETEEAHPFTIASAWDPSERRLTFITKELGDYTRSLPRRCGSGNR